VLAAVVEPLRVRSLRRRQLRPTPPFRPRARARGQPVTGVGHDNSRWNSANTDNIPNIARPSAVPVSKPCPSPPQPDLALAQLRTQAHQMQHRPAQPVQPRFSAPEAVAYGLADEVIGDPAGAPESGTPA
jgi:hypothetical protein